MSLKTHLQQEKWTHDSHYVPMDRIPSFWTAYKIHYMNFSVHSQRSKDQTPRKLKHSTAHHLGQGGGSPPNMAFASDRHEKDVQSTTLAPKSRWGKQQAALGKPQRRCRADAQGGHTGQESEQFNTMTKCFGDNLCQKQQECGGESPGFVVLSPKRK